MEFTFKAYRGLIEQLLSHGYNISDYHNHATYEKTCILRHDIDMSIEKAIKLSEIEKSIGVKATYFVMLTSDFYNVFSKDNYDLLKKLQNMGAEIGLHFDEVAYGKISSEEMISCILREKRVLSDLLDCEVSVVTMHRPSKWVLDSGIEIPGMINGYSEIFFKNFKYLSDSRMRWREDIDDYVKNEVYERLCILTHAFWYSDKVETLQYKLSKFIEEGNQYRYDIMNNNFSDLSGALKI